MTENEKNMSIKHVVCVLETIGSGLTLRNKKDREDVCALAIQMLAELEQYREIDTVENLQALKEKSVAKKPAPIDYEKYIDVVKNAKFLRGAYWCPNCKHTVMSGAYCHDCGQKLDWE